MILPSDVRRKVAAIGGTVLSAFIVVALIAPKPLNWPGVVIVAVLLSAFVLLVRAVTKAVRRKLAPDN